MTHSQGDKPSALLIKSATIYTLRLVLHTHDMQEIERQLALKLGDAPGYYEDESIVIDAMALQQPVSWKPLVQLLQKNGFVVLGCTVPETMASAARKAGLTIIDLPVAHEREPVPSITLSSTVALAVETDTTVGTVEPSPQLDLLAEIDPLPAHAASLVEEAATQTPAPSLPFPTTALIIDKPLRSGQKVYAQGTDLIVMAMVSHGAEVLADGNIYVFGPLRGRAMAGASGNEASKIYATQFNAELIAIAGVYSALTEVPDKVKNKPTWIQLKENKLLMEPFSL